MISVLIMYPQTADSTFDMDYYTSTHMPLFAEVLGDACKGWGASTVKGDEWAAYGWAMVESQEAFDAAMAAGGAKVMADVPNYTNISPQLLLGEVAHPTS
ncbi:MAG: EthD family reductase [Acidimicrobiales bacterium]